MDAQKRKAARARRRKFRVRKSIRGTATQPRLSVFRSNLHIYAQLIDDETAVTLVAASSSDKGAKLEYGGNIKAATEVGTRLATKAKEKGITKAAFDRGSYRFHGRVKALAQAATAAGLVCTGPPEPPKAPKEKAPEAGKPAKEKGGEKKPAGEKGEKKEQKKKEPAKA
jgi:large subunit ribosomal protein L18